MVTRNNVSVPRLLAEIVVGKISMAPFSLHSHGDHSSRAVTQRLGLFPQLILRIDFMFLAAVIHGTCRVCSAR